MKFSPLSSLRLDQEAGSAHVAVKDTRKSKLHLLHSLAFFQLLQKTYIKYINASIFAFLFISSGSAS